MNPARTVYVVIGCDVDPDRPGFLGGVRSPRLTWRGMTHGIPAVKELVHGVRDSAGREPVFTWFLRADEQVHRMEGAYAWVGRAHQPLLRTLEQSGDELAWHPHFWRRDSESGPWFQDVADVDWQVAMLRQAHADLVTSFPGPPNSVRMGWSYHNNRTFQTLETLGAAVDLSAIPGYRTLTGTPPARGENLFDWYSTPRAPFRPSRADYRRAPRNGEAACRLLEVPSFVSTSVPWSVVGGVQLTRKTGDLRQLWQAIRRPTYCINVTARPLYFAPLVRQLRRTVRRPTNGPLVFSTQFHADELMPNRSGLYDLASMRANLETLVRACERAGARLEFAPARRIPELWPD